MENRSEAKGLKGNALTRDEKALQEYRERWTSGN